MYEEEYATLCCDATIAPPAIEPNLHGAGTRDRHDSSVTQPERESGSSSRLLAAIRQSLRSSQYRELERLEITLRDRMVVLNGSVGSYYLKQVAQTAVLRVPGVGPIRNDVQVGG